MDENHWKIKAGLTILIVGGGLLGLISLIPVGVAMLENVNTLAPSEIMIYLRLLSRTISTFSLALVIGLGFVLSSIFLLKKP